MKKRLKFLNFASPTKHSVRLAERIEPPNSLSRVTSSGKKFDQNPSEQSEGMVETINQVETPKMYKVVLLNDDYTPMEFVTLVLKRYFSKNEEQATAIMLDVHKKGAGVAGVFTLEIAEMKVVQVNQFSRQNQHPLKTTLEPE